MLNPHLFWKQAEAELLSAIVMFFTRLGITSDDVGIKVSNRKVLFSFHTMYIDIIVWFCLVKSRAFYLDSLGLNVSRFTPRIYF